MERNINLEEISDGKLYGSNDMVKADCNDCRGCSACCTGMGKSVILDPLDIYRLMSFLGASFEELLHDKIELNVVDAIILPNLCMDGEAERCVFLNQEGRCAIHPHRPGFCRLFPLGRIYENRSFSYFLQVHECPRENKTKVKVKKWIDTPDLKKYEKFISDWHYFLKDMGRMLAESQEENKARETNLYVLKTFFLDAYDFQQDFYSQFDVRLEKARKVMG